MGLLFCLYLFTVTMLSHCSKTETLILCSKTEPRFVYSDLIYGAVTINKSEYNITFLSRLFKKILKKLHLKILNFSPWFLYQNGYFHKQFIFIILFPLLTWKFIGHLSVLYLFYFGLSLYLKTLYLRHYVVCL